MERNLSSYTRQILALCFVLAGLLTFAAQAHCLTMAPDLMPTQMTGHTSDSHHKMAADDDCHHADGCTSHSNWTFLRQPTGTAPVPHLSTSHAHYGQMLPARMQTTGPVAGNKQSPPPSNDRSGYPSVLTTTGRLLI